MRICLVQSQFIKGDVKANMDLHLKCIKTAIQSRADLIVFPELSLTNYEPKLANKLAFYPDDSMFTAFQQIADEWNIAIGIGVPTFAESGIHLSMLIFQSNKEVLLYTKGELHEDEQSYFVKGNNQPFIEIKGMRIVLGICFETLQRSHFLKAMDNKADLYIASVAKPEHGVKKAYTHFSAMSKEFDKPILMANAVGNCDDFLSVGQSAVWDGSGKLLGKLDEESQGLLIYDVHSNKVERILL